MNNMLKNKIVFESFSDFSDNTRTLFDYLIEKGYNNRYEMIWLVEKPENFIKINVPNVSFYNILPRNQKEKNDMINSISDAKILIGSNRNIIKCNKEQKYVNLWHGTLLKKLIDYKIDNKDWDYLLCPSEFYKDIYSRELRYNKDKIIIYNNPRIDDLFIENEALQKLYPSNNYKKFIIWMPTYRQHNVSTRIDSQKTFNLGIPIIDNLEKLNELDSILVENKCLLMLKIHPAQDLSKIKVDSLKNIKVVKNVDLEEKNVKLYNLIAKSDALITDYSSIYFDYMVLNRPIGFTIDDMQEYKGFVFENPLDYMPGEHIDNFDKFKQFIFDVCNGKDKFKEERNKINNLCNKYKDNKNCERIVEFLQL